MSKFETKFGKYFNLPNNGLRAYFGKVRSGQPIEYRTAFYEGKSLDEILSGWSSQVESLRSEWPSLLEFENDLRNKVGPMSIMKPLSERMVDIDHYYDLISLRSQPISPEAIDAAKDEWRRFAGLRMASPANTVAKMKKSTNSGSPYFTRRKKIVDNYPIQQIMDNHGKLPCAVLGWRGQEGGPDFEDVKQRVVWMFPLGVNISELQVYQPLIVAFQKANAVPAWVSMDQVDRVVTTMFDTKNPKDLVICTDFSKFDQHFNSDCQEVSRQLIEWLFSNSSEILQWSSQTFPIKYEIPLAFDYGKIRYGKHGMASGSGGTNADETLLHRTLQHEAAILKGRKLNLSSQCLGDDGVLTFPGCTVDDVITAYTAHGLEMNPDKQYASTEDCVYLRRWHHKDYRINGVCVGVYSTYRALGRLAEQERFFDEGWDKELVALRQLSILENVKWHPLREQFVEYCMKGDRYRLGLDIPGFFDKIQTIAKRATEYMPDFLGYTKSTQYNSGLDTGIESWWITQFLKSKA